MGSIASSLENGSVPSASALTQICGHVNTVSQCIRNQDCPDDNLFVQTMWNGLRDGITYLCTDKSANDAITQADEKINAPAVKTAMMKCNNTFSDAIYKDSSVFCSASNDMLQCMATASQSCGANAQRVVVTFIYKFLSPPASLINCKLTDPSKLTSGSPNSHASSLLFLALGLTVATLWKRG